MPLSKFLLSLDGRINRKPYWYFNGVLLLVYILMAIGRSAILSGIFALILFWPTIAVQAKRWHDRDKSAWWILIGLVPIVGFIWALVENGFLRGTAGDNRFGPDPLASMENPLP